MQANMGNYIELHAADGHQLRGYLARPAQRGMGSVIVIQEIFGVNKHIRSICDRFAAQGYTALAPALFDRQVPDFECGYDAADMSRAFAMIVDPDLGEYLLDTKAAIDAVAEEGPVSIVGFCLGGSVAFAAAASFPELASAVCYYGGHIKFLADQQPHCPTLMHFAANDEHIDEDDRARIIAARGNDCTIHVYDHVRHGFNCDERSAFDAAAASKAWDRTMKWIACAHG